jgi:hypothetical protein
LLADAGRYGTVTALSRACGVSRQTLTTWREGGRQALLTALTAAPAPAPMTDPDLTRAVLTLLVCGHASYRGIQDCLAALWGRHVGLGTIQGVVAEAGRRAQGCLDSLVPPQPCALALDELFNRDARAAYLSAVDARTGVVWATAGPAPADAESWTVLLWEVRERGGAWTLTLHDGGHAAAAGAAVADPTAPCARDVWHVLARWGQTQHRLDLRVAEAEAKLAIRERHEAAVAAGQRWRGKRPTTSAATQTAVVAQETALAEAVRFLGREVRRALEVVVLLRGEVLEPARRRQEIEAALALLADLARPAPPPVRTDLERLHAHAVQALPALLTCAETLAPVEAMATAKLGTAAMGVLGWAWQRRAGLDLDDDGVVAGLPAGWRAVARVVLHAWSGAVRTTSLAESWHALVRAHLAVHRGLSPGLLALLAVWHNHRVVARGRYAGTAPLQRSGLVAAPTDWLTALGYPPPAVTGPLVPFPTRRSANQEAAA